MYKNSIKIHTVTGNVTSFDSIIYSVIDQSSGITFDSGNLDSNGEKIVPAPAGTYRVELTDTGTLNCIEIIENIVVEDVCGGLDVNITTVTPPVVEPEPDPDSYSITFNVVDDTDNPISNVRVGVSGIPLQFTDSLGITVFSGLPSGTYDYSVSRVGFNSQTDTVVIIDNNITVNIVLTEIVVVPTYSLSLESTPLLGGSVLGAGTYEEGDIIPINAIPSADYGFIDWRDGGTLLSLSPTYSYTMPATNKLLTARFEEYTVITVKVRVLNIADGVGGTVQFISQDDTGNNNSQSFSLSTQETSEGFAIEYTFRPDVPDTFNVVFSSLVLYVGGTQVISDKRYSLNLNDWIYNNTEVLGVTGNNNELIIELKRIGDAWGA